MAPKRNPSSQPTSAPARSAQSFKTTTSTSSPSKSTQSAQDILLGAWDNYLQRTPQRVKLMDVFMAFLVVVGGLQFAYCVVAGNYVSPCLFRGLSCDGGGGQVGKGGGWDVE